MMIKNFTLSLAFCLFVLSSFCQFPELKSGDKSSAGSSLVLNSINAFTSSNLPVFIINTQNNQTIPDEPKITASLGVIYNGSGVRNNITDAYNYYNGYIGIEMRGNSTQNFPKKPYNFETRDSLGNNLDASFFGMPAENDWSLIASYLDHTFIRNILAYSMSRNLGRWASRCHLVELVLNGEYQGIYILTEKIKRDKNRVNIAKLDSSETYYPDITGGYIFEITGFDSNIGESRKLAYPEYDEAAPAQITYITNYDNSFRSVMNSENYKDPISGYNAWIDAESFVDEIIVQEAMRNSDAYGWSGYFHKDKDGKLNAGPVWDFDQSAGNSSYPDNGVSTGWLFSHPSTTNTPFFWKLLFADPVFSYKVKLRWQSLREGKFSNTSLMSDIDSIASLLSEAQAREFVKWPVLGKNIWRETYGYQQRNTYQKEVDYLKTFLTQRCTWMDTELAKIANPVTAIPITVAQSDDNQLLVYPNPVKKFVVFEAYSKTNGSATIQLYNNVGLPVQKSLPYKLDQGTNKLTLELNSNLPSGIYLYKVVIDNKESFAGRLVKID